MFILKITTNNASMEAWLSSAGLQGSAEPPQLVREVHVPARMPQQEGGDWTMRDLMPPEGLGGLDPPQPCNLCWEWGQR